MQDIYKKVQLIKKSKSKLTIRIVLHNVFILFFSVLSVFSTLASFYSSSLVTEFFQIEEYVTPDLFSLMMILCSLLTLVKTIDINKELEKQYLFNNFLIFQREHSNETKKINKQFSKLAVLIDEKVESNVESKNHSKRMFARFICKIIGIILGITIFIVGLHLKLPLSLICFRIGLFVYPIVIVEFIIARYINKTNDALIKEYSLSTTSKISNSQSLNFKCKKSIIYMAFQRYEIRYKLWTYSSFSLSLIAFVFSIIEFSDVLDPVLSTNNISNSIKLISLVLLLLSTVITTIQLTAEQNILRNMLKLKYLLKKCNPTSIFDEKYQSLCYDNCINDLDIARGKYEYNNYILEKKKKAPNKFLELLTTEDRARLAISRINGFIIYFIIESFIYCFLYCNVNLPLFIVLLIICLCIYFTMCKLLCIKLNKIH